MSHSKMSKRGQSLYLEKWNPNAKKYINECKICGSRGYSPVIESPDFLEENDPSARTVNRVIYAELTRALPPLPLDELGRCPHCAEIQDGK